MRTITRCIAVASTSLAFIGSQAAMSQAQSSPAKPAHQLIVRLASNYPQAAEAFMDALNRPNMPDHLLRHTQSGFPSTGRFLIDHRLNVERLAALPNDDPQRRLQRWLVLEYPSGDAANRAQGLMRANAAVFDSVLLDPAENRFSTLPNDTYYTYDRNIYSVVGVSNYVAHSLLGAPSAWNYVPGIAYVAIVDNGIHSSHEDLLANVRSHFSSSPIDEPGPQTYRGHGTHTAGILAAAGNSGVGVSGVC